MYTSVEQGTGALKMWGAYCDHPKCKGKSVGKFNRKQDAEHAAQKHDATHTSGK